MIELLIVILVIGILAAIALVSYQRQVQKGQNAEATANGSSALHIIAACRAEHSGYQWTENAVTASCDDVNSDFRKSGLYGYGPRNGKVWTNHMQADSWELYAYSRSGCVFQAIKTSGQPIVRSTTGLGCAGSTSW